MMFLLFPCNDYIKLERARYRLVLIVLFVQVIVGMLLLHINQQLRCNSTTKVKLYVRFVVNLKFMKEIMDSGFSYHIKIRK